MTWRPATSVILATEILLPATQLMVADIDEFKVKRQEVFEFIEKPRVTRDATSQPDRFVMTFASKGFCDATVAVEDANGNLILRVGRIGNVNDGKPLLSAGGPPNARSIGGDEVALFHPFDLATHSDRRLFIHDWGNARIVSVKLDYHATATVPLR